jgi:hypothetical protein
MKKPRAVTRQKKNAGDGPEDLWERIQQRAYELYQLRGQENGHALDDWLQAESEAALTK